MNEMTKPKEAGRAEFIANDCYDIALAYDIDSPVMYEAAGNELRNIAANKKAVNELRLSLTRPLDQSKKKIMDLFREPLARIEKAEQLLRSNMLEFRQKEKAKADAERREAERLAAEERRAQEQAKAEAEAKAAEAAAAVKNADAGRSPETAEQLKAEADAAAAEARRATEELELADVAPIATCQKQAPKVDGIGTRQNWKHEVEDLHALIVAAAKGLEDGNPMLAAFLQPDDKALRQTAKALKAQASIPGVRVYCEEGLSVRAS